MRLPSYGLILALWILGGTAFAEELTATPQHRVWVINCASGDRNSQGAWVEASDLRVGDRFLLADGSEAVLRATESADREVEPDVIRPNLQPSTLNFRPVTTYNFEVSDTHTYFVGKTGMWVHNASSRACYSSHDTDALVMPGGKPTLTYLVHRQHKDNLMLPVEAIPKDKMDRVFYPWNVSERPTWKTLTTRYQIQSDGYVVAARPFLQLETRRPILLRKDNFEPHEWLSGPGLDPKNACDYVYCVYELYHSKRFIYTPGHYGFNRWFDTLVDRHGRSAGRILAAYREQAVAFATEGKLRYQQLHAVHMAVLQEDGTVLRRRWRPDIGFVSGR